MRALYVLEQVDEPFPPARRTAELAVETAAAVATHTGALLVGAWEVVATTGVWPASVLLWELSDGWEAWRRLSHRSLSSGSAGGALSGRDGNGRPAHEARGAGRGQLLGAVPGCPTFAQLIDAGVTGELFVIEAARTRSGDALAYLAAVREDRAPVMTFYGHRLVGLYESVLDERDAVLVWATSIDDHVRLQVALDRARGLTARASLFEQGIDDRLVRWDEEARELCEWRQVQLLAPVAGSPLRRVRGRPGVHQSGRPSADHR